MTNNKTNNFSKENTSNMSMKQIKEIKEIKLKYLSEKENNMALITSSKF